MSARIWTRILVLAIVLGVTLFQGGVWADPPVPPKSRDVRVKYHDTSGAKEAWGTLTFDPDEPSRGEITVTQGKKTVFRGALDCELMKGLRGIAAVPDKAPLFGLSHSYYLGTVAGHASVPRVVRLNTNEPLEFTFSNGELSYLKIYAIADFANGGRSKENPWRWERASFDAIVSPSQSLISPQQMENAPFFRVAYPTPGGYQQGLFGGFTPEGKVWVMDGSTEDYARFRGKEAGDYPVRLVEAQGVVIVDYGVVSGRSPEPLAQIKGGPVTHAALFADTLEVARNAPLPMLPATYNPEANRLTVNLRAQDFADAGSLNGTVLTQLPAPAPKSLWGRLTEFCGNAVASLFGR